MRPLEDHLSPQELDTLPEFPEALAPGNPGNQGLLEHLGQCEECSSLAQTRRMLRGLSKSITRAGDGSVCPAQDIWLSYAAGLRSEEQSDLAAHAARCNTCADTLRDAMELLQLGQPEVSEQLIEDLASSTPVWQRRIVNQMMADIKSRPNEKGAGIRLATRPVRPRTWLFLSSAAALLLVMLVGGLAYWRAEHRSDADLLALAYNKQRNLAMRIPGGDPAPMASNTRGAGGLDTPTELLQLQLRARQHLDETPNDAYWHRIQGEISLLQGDGSTARRNFEIAQTANDRSSILQSDLAAAWFEIGEKTGSPEAYAEGAELLSKEIKQHPQNALLYYNRAICWARLGLKENALNDFKVALSTERSSAWRQAIQAEIDKLTAQSALRNDVGPFKPDTAANDDFETALATAVGKLLPHWNESQEARDSIIRISRAGVRHQDVWLRDWIAATHSTASNQADSLLSAAIRLGTVGSTSDSLAQARQALSLYQKVGNLPGQLRAQLAVVYALQRLDRSGECLSNAVALDRDLGEMHYAWIRTQLALEQADCSGISGDFDQAQRSFARSLALSDAAGFNQLHLRAMGSQALLLDLIGKPVAAWRMNTDGIKLCAEVNCPPIRHYQLLYNAAFGAEELNLTTVAAEVMSTAVGIAAQTGDVTTHAYALETLAAMDGRSGQFDVSAKAFSEADQVMRSGSHAPPPALYRAEWDTDRAEVLLHQGNTDEALKVLQQNGSGMERSDYEVGRFRYLDGLARAQLAAHDTAHALSTAWRAVSLAEDSLPTLHGTAARERWEHENGSAYAQLVRAYLQSGHPDEALQAWERFRRVPFGKIHEPPGRLTITSRLPKASQLNPDLRIVIIARLEDSYIVWLASAQPLRVLHTVKVTDGTQLRELGTTFYHLCSDRDSSLRDVKAVGARLYQALLSPFGDELLSSSAIWFDIDPSLEVVPLSAITTPAGDWLGTSHQLAITPPWWTLQPESALNAQPVNPSGKVVLVDGFGAIDRLSDRTDYSESSEIAALFAHPQLIEGGSTSIPSLKLSLESASIMHFSGHATIESGAQFVFSTHSDLPAKTLGADEIDLMRLTHCQLAVLAACNTTAISPHRFAELPDLRDAMLRSGAHTVIASTWEVDDHSTHELMLAFYRNILRGESPEQSLRAAENSIQAVPAWRHPFYWASFESFTN